MKPHFYKVLGYIQSSFSIRHQIEPFFGVGWHYHPELELHYLVKGRGVRFIGDNVSNFEEDELILVGQNLPHSWRSEEKYFGESGDFTAEAIVIQFLPNCLGRDFLDLPEALLIKQLYDQARNGIIINGKAKRQIVDLMYSALNVTNLDKLIVFLKILNILTKAVEVATISSFNAFYPSNETETLRLNKIYTYTLKNYKQDLNLEEVASIASLSVTSFCRYFKMMTKKTYHDFLVDVRISHACRLLLEDVMAAEVICFECGFNNVSNFYRQFKKVKGFTPLEYKRKFFIKKVF